MISYAKPVYTSGIVHHAISTPAYTSVPASTPAISTPASTTPVSNPTSNEVAPLPPVPSTKIDRNKATLVVSVPENASVYLVGTKMTTTGKERRFSIPIPDPDKEYTYPIRVEVIRDGKTLVSELKQKLRGGKEFSVAVAESGEQGEMLALVALK